MSDCVKWSIVWTCVRLHRNLCESRKVLFAGWQGSMCSDRDTPWFDASLLNNILIYFGWLLVSFSRLRSTNSIKYSCGWVFFFSFLEPNVSENGLIMPFGLLDLVIFGGCCCLQREKKTNGRLFVTFAPKSTNNELVLTSWEISCVVDVGKTVFTITMLDWAETVDWARESRHDAII